MSTRILTVALSAIALTAMSAAVAAQEGRFPAEIAVLPEVPLNMDNTDSVRMPAGPGRDYRVLWADPAIKDFVGLSENGWDFSKPDTIPGFGSMPHHESIR
jgi:hypothetical protein